MKHLIYILLILLTGITACQQRTPYPSAMQQAETVMNSRPDSALALLQDMTDTLTMLPEEAQMYHQLLTIQAKDKLYITHTSDSLINHIVEFYENYGNKDRLMMAYYYQGSTYRDMNDAPRALKAFHQALDAGKYTENLTLLGQIYGQMGTLFSYQKLYDEALEATRKALELYTLQEDSSRYPYLYRDIARIYSAKENNDSALHYYKRAYRIAEIRGLKRQIINVAGEMGCLHYRIGNNDIAKTMLNQVALANPKAYNASLYLGILFKDMDRTDSAYYYLKKVTHSKDIGQQCTAYQHLAQLAEMKGNRIEASFYHSRHQSLQDTINAITQTEEMEKYHLLYRFQRAEKENDNLRLTNEQRQSQIYLLLLSLSVALTIITVVSFYLKKKKQEVRIQAEKYRKHCLQQKAKNTASIKENKKRIKQLEMELEKSQYQNNSLHNQLLITQKELLEIENRQNEKIHASQNIKDSIFFKADIYNHFHKAEAGQVKISNEDWTILASTIDTYYPSFSVHLNELCPSLNDREFKVCLMIKANLTIKGMSNILKCDASAISKTRKRLFCKITGTEGSGKELDKIILDL